MSIVSFLPLLVFVSLWLAIVFFGPKKNKSRELLPLLYSGLFVAAVVAVVECTS